MLEEEAGVEDPQKEWGSYVLYRDEIPEKIDGLLDRKRTWKTSDQGCGVVGISFATDCYMDGRAGEITRKVVDSLANHERYARVLTRNPILALQDIDVFEKVGEYVTVGSSIPCMDAESVRAIEPNAPAPQHRLRGLREFNEHGVQTFVSMSPTYPTQGIDDIRKQLKTVSECNPAVIFHEPINPRGGNFDMTVQAVREAGMAELAEELDRLRNRERWLEYSLEQFAAVQKIGEELGLPVHLWPDRQHIKHTDGEVSKWLQRWKQRQSPERFANRDVADSPIPQIPSSIELV
jgi:DNA repair photolyase